MPRRSRSTVILYAVARTPSKFHPREFARSIRFPSASASDIRKDPLLWLYSGRCPLDSGLWSLGLGLFELLIAVPIGL